MIENIHENGNENLEAMIREFAPVIIGNGADPVDQEHNQEAGEDPVTRYAIRVAERAKMLEDTAREEKEQVKLVKNPGNSDDAARKPATGEISGDHPKGEDKKPPEGGQESQEILTKQETPSKYRNIAWTTAELEINQINHFQGLHDYHFPIDSERPVVAQTPNGFFCLDGWDLIQLAKSKGATTIIVDVDHMEAHSDAELCIRKMAIRMKTKGEVVYAEIMRNSRDALNLVLTTEEDVMQYNHGGRRDRKDMGENREDNVRVIIARRLGIEKPTLNTHINFCEYLSEQTIQFFVEQKVTRKFFDDTQPLKQREAKKLEGKKENVIEITKQISKLMEDEYAKFAAAEVERKQTKKQKKRAASKSAVIETPKQPDKIVKEEYDPDEDKKGSPDGITGLPKQGTATTPNSTIETIKSTVSNVLARLSTRLSEPTTIDELEASIAKELEVLLGVMNDLQHLKTSSGIQGA